MRGPLTPTTARRTNATCSPICSGFQKSRVVLHQAFGTMVVFQRQKKPDGSITSVLVYPEQVATGKLQPCTQ